MHRAFAIATVAPIGLWGLCVAGVAVLSLGAGCAIDEGSAHPCMVLGQDLGRTAYTLGVFAAWGPLLAGPVSVGMALVWGAATLARAFWRRLRR